MDDVEIIFKQVDTDKSGFIDRNEFVAIMSEHFKNETLIEEQEVEYILKLFKEEDVDHNGYLSIVQLKHLLVNSLECQISDEEFTELVNLTDANFDGKIDIEEFITMLNETGYNPCVSQTIRQIKKSRKISPEDFLKIFDKLPKSFIPSFIKENQKLLKNLPSATLRPTTDSSGILFKDILPKEFKAKSSMRPITTPICGRFIFDYASGVPIPDESQVDRNKQIVGRLIKAGVWSRTAHNLLGNTMNIVAAWSKNKEDEWTFENKNSFFNSIIFRFDKNDDKYCVVFELVLVINTNGKNLEFSSGYCEVPMSQLTKTNKLKLEIKGGTPKKQHSISKEDIRTKRTGFAKLTGLFASNKSELVVKFEDTSEFKKNEVEEVNFLPVVGFFPKLGLKLISLYRQFLGQILLDRQSTMVRTNTINSYFIKSCTSFKVLQNCRQHGGL